MQRDGQDVGTDAGVYTPDFTLKVSRFEDAQRLLVALAALTGALVSQLPLAIRVGVCAAVWLLLCLDALRVRRAGLCALQAVTDDDDTRLRLRFTDGTSETPRYAGHALLGTLAVFLYVERSRRWRWLGARRLCIARDAIDADSFRRLRAWVRLS